MRMRGLCRRRGDFRGRRLHDLDMADGADRRAVAGAHARRAHHAHIGAELFRQVRQQPLGAGQRAGQRIADPHRDGGGGGLALLHHVEMGVEGRDLVDLGERQLHLVCQARQDARRTDEP